MFDALRTIMKRIQTITSQLSVTGLKKPKIKNRQCLEHRPGFPNQTIAALAAWFLPLVTPLSRGV